MKKTKIFIAAIAILAGTTTLFTACKKKDSSSSSSTTSSIVGKWELSRERYAYTAPTVYNHDSNYTAGNGIIENFYASNTYSSYSAGSQDDSGTYTLTGNQLIKQSVGDTTKDIFIANITATSLDLSQSISFSSGGTTVAFNDIMTYNKK